MATITVHGYRGQPVGSLTVKPHQVIGALRVLCHRLGTRPFCISVDGVEYGPAFAAVDNYEYAAWYQVGPFPPRQA